MVSVRRQPVDILRCTLHARVSDTHCLSCYTLQQCDSSEISNRLALICQVIPLRHRVSFSLLQGSPSEISHALYVLLSDFTWFLIHILQGGPSEISHALFIVSQAVDRYKGLCEGGSCGAPFRDFKGLTACCTHGCTARMQLRFSMQCRHPGGTADTTPIHHLLFCVLNTRAHP